MHSANLNIFGGKVFSIELTTPVNTTLHVIIKTSALFTSLTVTGYLHSKKPKSLVVFSALVHTGSDPKTNLLFSALTGSDPKTNLLSVLRSPTIDYLRGCAKYPHI